MASQITPKSEYVFGFLRCGLPEDIIDIDFKIHTIQGFHTYKGECDSCTNKLRPLGIHVMPFEPLKERIYKFRRQKQATATATPSCNYSQQPPGYFERRRERVYQNKHC